MIVRVTGGRCWVVGQRVHHGLTGFLLTAAGLALMLHDRADWRVWFKREGSA